MDLDAKLQLKPGQTLAVVNDQPGVLDAVDRPRSGPDDAEAVLVFVRSRAELDAAEPAVRAASRDVLAWVAYPKAGRLGTDLNRDILAAALTARGLQPVRQVALDDVWSALRFRPA